MKRALLAASATLALACGEAPTTPKVDTVAQTLNLPCEPGCGIGRVTLHASELQFDFGGGAGDPPNTNTFSCDSLWKARSFVGTATDDRDPLNVGQWRGELYLSPPPLSLPPPDMIVGGDPFEVQGIVSFSDERAWQGFFMTYWNPSDWTQEVRSCEFVDGILRIRVETRGGYAVSSQNPDVDGNSYSGAGLAFVSGLLEVSDQVGVLSSSFTMRLLAHTDPASITLSPAQASPQPGSAQTLTATVKDRGLEPGTENPVSNASVVFAITGSTTTSLQCSTDASGHCSVSYSGVAGVDQITAFADIDGDASLGLGEPSATAQIDWGDVSPPVVATPSSIVAEATGPDGATVTFVVPEATDDVGVVGGVECSPASGSQFPLGATTVTCSASDAAGNTGSSTFEVSVVDTTAPTISFSGNAGSYTVDQTVSITCSATDLVTASPEVTCSGGSGPAYDFDVGTNQVTATARDEAGNESSASTTFVVTVTVASICNLVQGWSSSPSTSAGLCQTLDALGDRLSPRQRANLISSFIGAIERQRGRAIPADKADILIRLAAAL